MPDSPKKRSLTQIRRDASLARKTKSGGHNGGRPLSQQERCLCGAMTRKRALTRWPARKGRCNAPECVGAE